jgi:hypothetical protein
MACGMRQEILHSYAMFRVPSAVAEHRFNCPRRQLAMQKNQAKLARMTQHG